MNVVLLGPPGSGKGTQGEILARRLGVPKIATGELLSEAVQKNTMLGRQAKRFMDRGEMVPDKIILSLVKEQVLSPDAAEGIVLDGFPRTTEQAEAVDRMLAAGVQRVLLLDVPEDELVQRLVTRAAAAGRSDETPDAIRRRLDVYRRSTATLVMYYREMGVLKIVPGTGTVEQVAEAVKMAVGV
jgi:adenylate kinase